MKVSVLQQMPVYQYNQLTQKPPLALLKQKSQQNMERCFEMLESAGREGADLAVTIECVNAHLSWADMRYPFGEVYEGLDGPLCERFARTAKRLGMHIVAGLYLSIEGRGYNCAVLFNPRGEIAGVHKKVHLPAGEEFQVTHGDRFEVFHTDIGNIGMLVCWDMQFPESVRELTLGGADLIACPTWGWENIYGLCRAYESSVYIAAAMGINRGTQPLPPFCDPSCIVDNMGRIVAAAGRTQEQVVTADIDPAKDPQPQYTSENYIDSFSMRKTRMSQRRPETYRLITQAVNATPLYRRYFEEEI